LNQQPYQKELGQRRLVALSEVFFTVAQEKRLNFYKEANHAVATANTKIFALGNFFFRISRPFVIHTD